MLILIWPLPSVAISSAPPQSTTAPIMCDYNALCKKTVTGFSGPLAQIIKDLNIQATKPLLQAIRQRRAWPGRDLIDGSMLPPEALGHGYYLQQTNFQRELTRMATRPDVCPWCGGRLPTRLLILHRAPHDHREEIRHHFHDDCWTARLIGLAVVFGHVSADAALKLECSHQHHRLRRRSTQHLRRRRLGERCSLFIKVVLASVPARPALPRRRFR
jgi:hypothetical protein